MASTPYELQFKLNAQTSSSFNSTFGKAQARLSELSKEISSLNKVQSDITSYQKQQSSLANTADKLQALQQQYNNIQREIQETGKFSSSLENRLIAKQRQIEKTSDALRQQQNRLDSTSDALKTAGINTNDLKNESAKLQSQISKLNEEQKKINNTVVEYGQKGSNSFQTVANALIAAGLVTGLRKIAEGYMECINLSAEFEETISTVKALSGADDKETAQLSTLAKKIGAETKYTATQAATAMTYMGMAGWNAGQMLSGMDGVIQLAAASGEDLGTVSDIVTDNLTAFGLKAEDTAYFSDVLAAAATNSNTSVGIMGETFKKSASVAGALNYKISDIAIATGLMANSGVKGSIAGTALKNTFNGLLEGVTLTAEKFGDYEFSCLKADGTMKTFRSTVEELREKFSEMTETEKVANAQAIAGEQSYNGLLAILNATDKDYQSLSDSIDNCSGSAAKMAAIKLDNLNGDLALCESAYDALRVTIGEQFNPEMRNLYSIGSNIFTGLEAYIRENPEVLKAAAAFIGVVGTATAALTLYAAAIKVIKALELGSIFASPVGIIIGATAAIGGLVAAMIAWEDTEKDTKYELENLTAASREQYEELQTLQAEYDRSLELYGENSDKTAYLKWQIDELSKSYENNKQSLSDYLQECKDLNEEVNNTLSANNDAYKEVEGNGSRALSLTHRLQELAQQTDNTTERSEEMKAIVSELNNLMPDLNLNYEKVTKDINKYGKAIENTVKAQSELDKYETAQKNKDSAYAEKEKVYAAMQGNIENRKAKQRELAEAEKQLAILKKIADSTGQAQSLDAWISQGEKVEYLKKQLSEIESDISEQGTAYRNALADYERYVDEVMSYTEDFKQSTAGQSEALAESIGTVTQKAKELADAYSSAYGEAFVSISDQYKLWDEIKEVTSISSSSIIDNISKQSDYWSDYSSNLQKLFDKAGNINGLRELLASFADESEDSVKTVAGMANATDDELTAMVKNWSTLHEKQKEVSGNLAEIKEDFSRQMKELEKQIASDIKGMNFNSEAASSGQLLVEEFIEGAQSQYPAVQSAFKHLGKIAAAALSDTSDSKDTTDLQTFSSVKAKPKNYENGKRYAKAYSSGTKYIARYAEAYASGTKNAKSGLALVGEYGPELVYLNGGEQILTADETAAALQNKNIAIAPEMLTLLSSYSEALRAEPINTATYNSASSNNTVQVTFHIEGNADRETVKELNDNGDNFAERVLQVIADANYDSIRRSYI